MRGEIWRGRFCSALTHFAPRTSFEDGRLLRNSCGDARRGKNTEAALAVAAATAGGNNTEAALAVAAATAAAPAAAAGAKATSKAQNISRSMDVIGRNGSIPEGRDGREKGRPLGEKREERREKREEKDNHDYHN